MALSLRSQLTNWPFRFLPRETSAVITTVFMGLIMTVILQISNLVDTALAGGTIPILSAVVCSAIWIPAAMFYGLTGALTTAWINPVIANLTASSPMAPFLFLTNAAHTVPIALLTLLIKRRDRGLRLWQVIVIGQLGGVADSLVYGLGNRLILQMPWDFITFQVLVTQPCFLVGSLVTFAIMRRLLKTGLIARDAALRENEIVI